MKTIGEIIENTSAFGTVTVKDIFVSISNSKEYVYLAIGEEGEQYWATEEELSD